MVFHVLPEGYQQQIRKHDQTHLFSAIPLNNLDSRFPYRLFQVLLDLTDKLYVHILNFKTGITPELQQL